MILRSAHLARPVVVLFLFCGLTSSAGYFDAPGLLLSMPVGPHSRVPSPEPQVPSPQSPTPIRFADVTSAAGIRFKHNSGAFGKKYLPETLGSGCAFLDFDNDGWQDILFVNSKNWPGRPGVPSYPALYRNNRNGTFTDVTKQAGLAVELYGFGIAAADYDNDGHTDVYITALGQIGRAHV